MDYFGKAKQAAEKSNFEQAKEEINLAVTAAYAETNGEYGEGFKTAVIKELEQLKVPDIKETEDSITGTHKGYKFEINVQTGDVKVEGTQTGTTPNLPDYDETKGVNKPKIADGMIPIKWNGSKWVVCSQTDPEWYNYVDQTSGQDGQSKWANIMLSDGTYKSTTVTEGQVVEENQLGSMFVWIPRYSYSIETNYHTNSANGGQIKIAFLEGTKEYPVGSNVTYTYQGTKGTGIIKNESGQGNWNVHPAFQFGEQTVSGIWVAKFEAGNSNCTTTASTGEAAYTSKPIKIQPNKTSWRIITPNDVFNVCQEMSSKYAATYGISNEKTKIDPHEMKNSEWGAVAYLTQSNYGRNNKEITINSNSSYLTGGGNYVSNIAQSSTGNTTGIYDLSGGAYEYIASYVDNKNSKLTEFGASLVSANAKYKDVYKATTDTREAIYEENKGRYGEATYEISNSYSSSTGAWWGDYSGCPYSTYPFFIRGDGYGSSTSAGVFAFNYDTGRTTSSYSFRPVVCAL